MDGPEIRPEDEFTEWEMRELDALGELLMRILAPRGPLPKATLDRMTEAAMDAYHRGVRDVPPHVPFFFGAIIIIGFFLGAGGALPVSALALVVAVAIGCGVMLRDVFEFDDPP